MSRPFKPANSPYWHFDFRLHGIRYHGSTRLTSKRDAQNYIDALRRRILLGEQARPALTVLQACDAWWDAKGRHMRSHATIKYQLVNLAEGLGPDLPLQDVALIALDRYLAARRASVSNSSVNRETALLRRVVNWCAARGYEAPDIAWSQIRLKEPPPTRRVLSDDEEARLFAHLPDNLKPIVKFALLSGQRKSEIVTLCWADVDLVNARATVWAKGQRPHSFPLTPAMAALIKAQPRVCPQVFTYVCQRAGGGRKDRVARIRGERYPFSPAGWTRQWKKALHAAGIEASTFHHNRHTAATRLAGIESASQLLGHASIKTTERYFHPGEEALRRDMLARDSRTIPEEAPSTKKKAGKNNAL